MSNILVVDVQKGFLNEENKDIVIKINDYLKNNEFDNVIYTKFVTNHQGNSYKNIFWDGLYEKEEQKIAVKKLQNAKVFKKKCHGLTNLILKYLKEKNITEIQICGIDNDGDINLIYMMLENAGIKADILTSLVCKSSAIRERESADYTPNLVKTVNGFYVGDIIGCANNQCLNQLPEITEKSCYSDCTILTFAVLEWLLQTKHKAQEMLNILSYYYKLYPEKDKIYSQEYVVWAKNGCRSYRMCNDNVAIRMCSPIGWYASSLNEIDELIKNCILPANNSSDAELGAKLVCYAIWYLRNGTAKTELIAVLQKYFDLNLLVSYEQSVKNITQTDSPVAFAIVAILAFAKSKSYEDAVSAVLGLNNQNVLTSTVSALAEVYYKNLPLAYFNKCRDILPEKFKKLLLDFAKSQKVKIF